MSIIKMNGRPFDWTYWMLMSMVVLGLIIIAATFIAGPIWLLMGK